MTSLEGFLDSVKSETSVLLFPPHHSLKPLDGFTYPIFSLLGRTLLIVRISYPPALPHHSNGHEVVQEFRPVVHCLRLLASA